MDFFTVPTLTFRILGRRRILHISVTEVWTPESLPEFLVGTNPVLREAALKIPGDHPFWPIRPGECFNAMINPITRFAIGGVIWYQGESNVVLSNGQETDRIDLKSWNPWRS